MAGGASARPRRRGAVRRWLRRLALALLLLAVALTLASLAYNAATGDGERPAGALYAGPFLQVGDTRVAYRAWGSAGSPIVLLGGFAEPSFVWDAVGPLLGRTHRVFALDLPPFGYTERRGPYTLAAWAALARGFAAQLRLSRPLYVGHSLGAAVAVQEALSHPADVTGVVLLDGDALAGGGTWLANLVFEPFYTSLYRILTGSDWVFRRALHSAYGPGAPPITAAEIERWRRPFHVSGTRSAFRALLRRGIQGFRLPDLRRVAVRSLVVWGAHDTVDPVAAGRKTAAALRTKLVLVPGAGHLSPLEQPAAVAAAIESLAG